MPLTANDLLLKYWDGSLPVDVENIASKLGIEVCKKFGMPSGESGSIIRTNGDEYIIEFDVQQSLTRQRFTIAHELGHFALGHLTPGKMEFRDGPENFSSDLGIQAKEASANKFAAELLMPRKILEYLITNRGMVTVSSLSQTFKVSKTAMMFRLRNIGIPVSSP